MSTYYPRTKDLARTRKSLTDSPPSSPSYTDKNYRVSFSSLEVVLLLLFTKKKVCSYTRREARLAALNKQEEDSTAKDYKKMYTEALQENERLKSKLQDSKQELVKIRSQLEKVAQRQDRLSERSTVLETEKRVSFLKLVDSKVLKELKSDNQRLKDENGALIRVISKLSK
uniref:Protein phosphatase 1, regulatory subunit 12B n=1 Tax=Cyprinodon variegatus TaxID=28743 RepID=A0A3Q2GRV3_CYPVA